MTETQVILNRLEIIEDHLRALVNLQVKIKVEHEAVATGKVGNPGFYDRKRKELLTEIYVDFRKGDLL